MPEVIHDYYFEVQIRSILEHAWAEHQHQLFYKSGLVVSKENTRSLAAVAGTLELLDGEFERLRSVLENEVEIRRQLINDGLGSTATLDTAGVIAILDILAPHNPSFLGPNALPTSGASILAEAFLVAGLTTVDDVEHAFKGERFISAAERFASLSGLDWGGISHMAIGALLVATQDGFPLIEFRDVLSDSNLIAAIDDDNS